MSNLIIRMCVNDIVVSGLATRSVLVNLFILLSCNCCGFLYLLGFAFVWTGNGDGCHGAHFWQVLQADHPGWVGRQITEKLHLLHVVHMLCDKIFRFS
jgi:hypothetical protein